MILLLAREAEGRGWKRRRGGRAVAEGGWGTRDRREKERERKRMEFSLYFQMGSKLYFDATVKAKFYSRGIPSRNNKPLHQIERRVLANLVNDHSGQVKFGYGLTV